MAISPNYLPIDLTSEQWTIEHHFLTAQAAMINQITQAVNGMLVLDEVLNSIALQLVDALQASGCLIFQPDEEQPRVTSWMGVATPQQDGKDFLPERLYSVCREFCQYYHHSRLAQGNPAVLLWSGYSCGEGYPTPTGNAIANAFGIEQLPLSLRDGARECGISTLLIVPILHRQSEHEFRTPLTTILSSAELLEHYTHKWTDEKKLTHLHCIQTAVKHMTKLLNDVLILGKADAGKLPFNPAPLDLENFCRNLVEELQLNDIKTTVLNFPPSF